MSINAKHQRDASKESLLGLSKALKRATDMQSDAGGPARAKCGVCKYCWYVKGEPGHAKKKCQFECEECGIFSTGTLHRNADDYDDMPMICLTCSNAKGWCVMCTASLAPGC